MALISTVMAYDRPMRPGPVGYAVDVVRWSLAWSAVYQSAIVLPVVLPGIGAVLSSVVVLAGLLVAAPGWIARCGLPAAWIDGVRAGAWVALTVALLSVLSVSITRGSNAGLQLLGGTAVIVAVMSVAFRFVRWADLDPNQASPVSRRFTAWRERRGSGR